MAMQLWADALPAHGQTDEPAPSTSQDSAHSVSDTLVLQGGVKHKEFLDPVPTGLQAGANFDEQSLPKLVSANNWIPIPGWMAGTWQYKTENVTAMINYTNINYTRPPYTIRNQSQKVLGQQKDKTGQVWHYLKAPYSYTAKLSHGIVGYERVSSAEALSLSDDAVVLKIIGTDTQVNPKTQVVTSTDQSEDFNRYSPLGKDGIVNGGSAKHFDMNGHPTMDMTSHMIAKRIKPYTEIDEQDGENLKQLFVDFLRSHGKENLVP